jgi:hypothetical protein
LAPILNLDVAALANRYRRGWCAKKGSVMHAGQLSVTLKAINEADKLDCEFFKSNPENNEYRRPVVPGELPDSLQSLDICAVSVRRIDDGIFFRIFVDSSGHPVFPSLFIDPNSLSTPIRQRHAEFCRKLFDDLCSLASKGQH